MLPRYRKLLVLVMWVILAPLGHAVGTAWDLVHPDAFDWRQRAHRHSVAADLISRISLLAAVIPAQSPAQVASLKATEAEIEALGSAATPRQRSRLYLSRAYQHRRLIELLEDMLTQLRCVRGAAQISAEMVCWVEVSVLLMDEETLDISLTVLRQSRMIPRDEDMPTAAQDPKVWYSEYGRGVVRNIIRPYLQSWSSQPECDSDA